MAKELCMFCRRGPEDLDKTTVGETYQRDGITAHEYCLYFASGLCQRGERGEGICGFMAEDIWKEVKRGWRLRCSVCRKTGGSIGCSNPSCRKQGHYPCLREAGYLFQYYDTFRAYCPNHCPTQSPLEGGTTESDCCVCLSVVEGELGPDFLYCPSCKKIIHRHCLQAQALSSGWYYFKCPVCNERDAFILEMLRMGVRIPVKDAEWEAGGQFSDLYEILKFCTADVCLSRRGRQHFSARGVNSMKKCTSCGQCLGHVRCMQRELSHCEDCVIPNESAPSTTAVTPSCSCTICIAKAVALCLTPETAHAIRGMRKRRYSEMATVNECSTPQETSVYFTPPSFVRLPPGLNSQKPMVFREVFPVIRRASFAKYRLTQEQPLKRRQKANLPPGQRDKFQQALGWIRGEGSEELLEQGTP